MPKTLTSLRLDFRLVDKARRILNAKDRTEAIEASLAAIIEMDKHRKIIDRFSGKGKPDDFARS
ncbi:MAG: hypothetical protein HYR55_06175 [Acidobacteria bacterium]|nr:hypothetical protein [Acidobacteriota bacterium]MBI3656626.1 hypothetical protein [Acidobacteriota bacterium]